MSTYHVESGQTSTGIILNSADTMYVYESGTASSTTINGGYLNVSSGGTANLTTVNSNGLLYVSSGGLADDINLAGGDIYVEGSATNIDWTPCVGRIILRSADAYVTYASSYSGVYLGSKNQLLSHAETMSDKEVSGNLVSMYVMSGGSVRDIAVEKWGGLYVSSGGTADNIFMNGGELFVRSGGSANIVFNPWAGMIGSETGATLTIQERDANIYYGSSGVGLIATSSSVINNCKVENNCSAIVYSGGTANNTTLEYLGGMYISSGGIANETIVGGWLVVSTGGTANRTSLAGGLITVESAGNADGITAASNDVIRVSCGGTATNISASSQTKLFITAAPDTYVQGIFARAPCEMTDGKMSGFTFNTSSILYVQDGGTADDTTINSATMHISSGGTANRTAMNGGSMTVSGGTVNNTIMNGGSMTVSDGTANSTTVNSGRLYISSGGTANSTTISGYYAYLHVSSGGTANSTAMNGGSMFVSTGGTANSTTVNSGRLYVSSGGTADSITVNYGGWLDVSSGGTASIVFNPWQGNVVSSDGAAVAYFEREGNIYYGNKTSGVLSKYTSLTDFTITEGNSAIIYTGGSASNTIISSGGNLTISSGGSHKGSLLIESGATVSTDLGAEIQFSLAGRTAADDYLINDLSAIQGDVTYSITTAQDQSFGTYRLARNANDFTGSVLIQCGVSDYESITVNGERLLYGKYEFTLSQNNGDLLLAVEERPSVFVYSSGILTSSGMSISDAKIRPGSNDSMYIASEGFADNIIVDSGGIVFVDNGGTANIAFHPWQGTVSSADGANVNYLPRDAKIYRGNDAVGIIEKADLLVDFTISSGTSVILYSGGTARNTVVNRNGVLRVSSGGLADYVKNLGKLVIADGGSGNEIVMNGGELTVASGASVSIMFNPWSQGTVTSETGASITYLERDAKVYLGYGEGGFGSNGYISKCDSVSDIVIGGLYSAFVYSGGYAGNIVLRDTDLHISSGGTVEKVFIESGRTGRIFVSGGGLIRNVTISGYGTMSIIDGGVAYDTLSIRGRVSIESGGVASSIRVYGEDYDCGALLSISKGGSANDLSLDLWGTAYISSGGRADNITMCGGSLTVSRGGSASIVYNPWSAGYVTSDWGATVTYLDRDANVYYGSARKVISKGDSMTGLEITAGKSALIYEGGTVDNVTMDGGSMTVSGGTVNSTDITGGYFHVSSGGTANTTTMDGTHYNTCLYVSSGGTVNSTTVKGGTLYVFSGGTANSTMVRYGGFLQVSSGGTASIVFNPWQAKDHIVSYGGATVEYLDRDANIYYGNVKDGLLSKYDSISAFAVEAGNTAIVYSGGTANSTTINGGSLDVSSGGTASSTTMNGGGLNVCGGGTANSTTMNGGGLYVYEGGTANSTTVNSRGYMHVYDGGTANSTTVNSGGKLYVSSGGTADSITVNYGGRLDVSSGGTASIVFNPWQGTVSYYFGSPVEYLDRDANIYYGNREAGVLSKYDSISAFTIESGNSAIVYSGGTANSTIVNSGGWLDVCYGGKITGPLTMDKGAVVSAYEGGIVDFAVADRTTEDDYLINDLSLIQGAPVYTITIAADLAAGIYKLAQGAASFTGSIEVCTDDTCFGSITVGSTVEFAGQSYTLNLADDLLSLTVGGPVPPVVAGDLNGDGRADIVMTITQSGHGAEGATGAWLIQQDQTAAWGDLSQRNAGWEIFGMGTTSANKTTNDVYVRGPGNVIGAWTTNESGAVSGWETIGEFSADTQVLGLGDFNGNGQTDLLLRNTNGAVGCYFTGGEKTGWNYFQSLGDEWKIAAVGDLNGDGRADVVLKHDAGFAGSWLTQADGTMAWANLDTLPDGFAIIGAGDFNGDGTDDVLLQKGTYFGAWVVQDGSVSSWMGLGDLGDVTVEQIADFDGDGKDDLRIRTAAGDLGAQLVKGADSLEWKYYGSVGSEWSTSLAAI